MKTIPLSSGMVAVVDDEDFAFLIKWKWSAVKCRTYVYARRGVVVERKKHWIYMHRLIAGAVPGQGVDHKDRCTLNNRRNNLRLCSRTQNLGNSHLKANNSSGFKGVYRAPSGKYIAQIKFKNKTTRLGGFHSAELAAARYDQAAIESFGEFALTNKALGLLN